VGETEIAFFVQQAYRRRGIGTALVKAVLRWAEQRGLRRVWAMSVAENALAMRLLKRCGFRFLQYVLPGIELVRRRPHPNQL
jgi:RimJ/RimL family protein N-acetyltransferase